VPIPIIYESHRRFLFDLGVLKALTFLERVFDGSVNIVRTVADDEDNARTILARYQGLRLTLADAANVAIMVRLGIAAIFSYDDHYPQIGVIRIPPLHL
jgi:predicted nucleic acid-binding protein